MLTCTDTPLAAHPAANLLLRDVWKASELARSRTPVLSSGHPTLDALLPDGGWPRSVITELLVQQHGCGEVHLLASALMALPGRGRIVLIQPPYLPQAAACGALGIDTSRLLWIRAASTADALWSAEQVLKNNCCTAVLMWQTNIRTDALRRLNLAAQRAETWMWLFRPLAQARDASPAPLRLALRPANGHISVEVVKRRGPLLDGPVLVPLVGLPSTHLPLEVTPDVAPAVVPAPTQVTARIVAPVLV